ncbi:MAG TPA: hypothetical protein VGS07_08575 [Thermoanaerobaculia bacterium]|jgi:serine protease|nr:hypothetical protein [Thermoanaerobaculia bacterium]
MIKSRSFRFQTPLVLALLVAASAPVLADGPYQFFPVAPCRVVDTRNPNGVNAGPALPANQTRKFRIQGNCSVPIGAKAVTLNATVVSPGSAGWLGVYPSTGFSGTSTINFDAGEFAIANGAIVPLSPVAVPADLDISAFWGNYSGVSPQTHVVIDVTGYFQ